VSDAGSGSGILRLRRTILLLFGEKKKKRSIRFILDQALQRLRVYYNNVDDVFVGSFGKDNRVH
jgi:hypothetical protein